MQFDVMLHSQRSRVFQNAHDAVLIGSGLNSGRIDERQHHALHACLRAQCDQPMQHVFTFFAFRLAATHERQVHEVIRAQRKRANAGALLQRTQLRQISGERIYTFTVNITNPFDVVQGYLPCQGKFVHPAGAGERLKPAGLRGNQAALHNPDSAQRTYSPTSRNN